MTTEDKLPPKTSHTVSKPPPYSAAAQRERDRLAQGIELQAEQDDTRFVAREALAKARATQDWTPFYNGLITNAARYAALEGGSSADQLAINQMLVRPDPEHPRDPNYRPSPEALALIEAQDAAMAKAQEAAALAEAAPGDKEASLAAREAALDAREAAVAAKEVTAREEALAAREVAIVHREESARITDEDGLRDFRPSTEQYVRPAAMMGENFTDLGAWAGRKRMTAEERAAAEAEGMELFGIDPMAGSAWSKVSDVAGQPQGPRHGRNPKLEDPAQRIAAINDARERAAQARTDQDPDAYAEALADQEVYEQAGTAADAESEAAAYERRQREAQETVDAFKRDHQQRGWL